MFDFIMYELSFTHTHTPTIAKYEVVTLLRIDPGLKGTVYCTAIREGGEKEWNFIFELYKTATVQAEKSRLLSALSCTRKIWILNK